MKICPKCGSQNITPIEDTFDADDFLTYECRDCGFVWEEHAGYEEEEFEEETSRDFECEDYLRAKKVAKLAHLKMVSTCEKPLLLTIWRFSSSL